MIMQFVLITCDGVLDGLKNCTGAVSGATVAQARAKGGWHKFLGGDLCPECYKRAMAQIKRVKRR